MTIKTKFIKTKPEMYLIWEVFGKEQNRKKIDKLEIRDNEFKGTLDSGEGVGKTRVGNSEQLSGNKSQNPPEKSREPKTIFIKNDLPSLMKLAKEKTWFEMWCEEHPNGWGDWMKNGVKIYQVWEDLLDKVTLERELPNQELRLVEVVKLIHVLKKIEDVIKDG